MDESIAYQMNVWSMYGLLLKHRKFILVWGIILLLHALYFLANDVMYNNPLSVKYWIYAFVPFFSLGMFGIIVKEKNTIREWEFAFYTIFHILLIVALILLIFIIYDKYMWYYEAQILFRFYLSVHLLIFLALYSVALWKKVGTPQRIVLLIATIGAVASLIRVWTAHSYFDCQPRVVFLAPALLHLAVYALLHFQARKEVLA